MTESRRQILEQLLDLEQRAESLRRQLNGEDPGSSFGLTPLIDDEALLEIHRLVVDNLAEAVLVVTPQGVILAANGMARRMFRLSREQLGQITLRELLGDLVDPLVADETGELSAKGARFSQGWVELEGIQRDLEVLMISAPAPIAPYHCLMLRDVSAQRRAERDRDRLVDQLAAKHRELESVIHRVSHDLKSPLVTIAGFSNLLQIDLKSPQLGTGEGAQELVHELQDHAAEISQGVQKAQRLVDRLLELTRVGQTALKWGQQDLDALVDQVLKGRAPQIQESDIEVQIEGPLGPWWGDHQQLLSVFENLIDNAVRFLAGRPQPRLVIGRRNTPHGSALFVADNGPGIPADQAERVFDLFVRFDRNHKGSGIGLALVRRIVDAHGGRVWLESQPGEGSTFLFTLAAEEPISK